MLLIIFAPNFSGFGTCIWGRKKSKIYGRETGDFFYFTPNLCGFAIPYSYIFVEAIHS